MNHFNQIANSWDTPEKIKMCQLYAEQIAHHLVKKDALKILEVGCGTGLLGSYFINDKNYFIGIDSLEGMLEVFKQKFKEYKMEPTDATYFILPIYCGGLCYFT